MAIKIDKIPSNTKIHVTELGNEGFDHYMGFISEAYNAELLWPSVQPLYSRIRRSDPEITIIRQIFTALTRQIVLRFELPDDANDDEKKAKEFGEEALRDIDGGTTEFLETTVSNVPFFGWGWFEVLNGYRDPDWRPPDKNDKWQSQYNDGLVGVRRLAWRDSSSFKEWILDPETCRLLGMIQSGRFGTEDIILPLENSLHVTFGDVNNPEGLTPLEAVWRLERIKYGLEVINGIGFEHAAGYLNVTVDGTLSEADKTNIKKAARAIMTAQEGNYATWPKGVDGEVKDIPFSAASSLLAAIKYYGILKLSIYNSQWVALSSTTGSGSFSAMQESSSMFMTTYNSMMAGFIRQVDEQVFKKLFELNALAWPNMVNRPRLTFSPIKKKVSLDEIGNFISKLDGWILGDEDIKAIRERTGILPTAIPEEQSIGIKETVKPANLSINPENKKRIRSAFEAYVEKAKDENPEMYALVMKKLGAE